MSLASSSGIPDKDLLEETRGRPQLGGTCGLGPGTKSTSARMTTRRSGPTPLPQRTGTAARARIFRLPQCRLQ